MLAVLSVNRQVYMEAMPIFYNINHFRFESCGNLATYVSTLPRDRLKHLRHMSVTFKVSSEGELDQAQRAFDMLAQYGGIRDIELVGSDWDWRSYDLTARNSSRSSSGPLKYDEHRYVGALTQLIKTVRKVSFRKHGTNLEKYLQEQIEKKAQ